MIQKILLIILIELNAVGDLYRGGKIGKRIQPDIVKRSVVRVGIGCCFPGKNGVQCPACVTIKRREQGEGLRRGMPLDGYRAHGGCQFTRISDIIQGAHPKTIISLCD